MAAKKKAVKKAAVKRTRLKYDKTFYVIYTERGSGDTIAEEMTGPDEDEIARRFVNRLNDGDYAHDLIQDQGFRVVPADATRWYNLRIGFSLAD